MKLKSFLYFLIFAAALNSVALNIDSNKVTISGLSSGAYMAGQMHMIHSKVFSGVGIIAGGPYYCSRGSIEGALKACIEKAPQLPSNDSTVKIINKLAADNTIDAPKNLENDKIFLFAGALDQVVPPQLVEANKSLFKKLQVKESNIFYDGSLNAGHAFPTNSYGNSCTDLRTSPYISSCKVDTAEKVLTHMYGPLKAKAVAKKENFIKFSQKKYTGVDPQNVSMNASGVAYIPSDCKKGKKCKLHVILHGCRQTIPDIKDQFYTKTGYNEWAESNSIVLIYPQTVRNESIGNPRGCWDYWGYTGKEFYLKNGKQVKAIYKMVQDFSQSKNYIVQ